LYTPGSVAQRTPLSISSEPTQPTTLTRKQLLEKVNCQPRDKLEEAVCASDFASLSALLSKKKSSFWRSTLRKRVRPERVTALHFAALFNEVSMARLLVDAGFNVNEIPFGYSTPLTPLHFAIGARRVEMAEFLVSNGAKPVEKDTWGSMAAQLLSRAWLIKTLSESERDGTADRIIGVMNILLKAGWDVNAPIDAKGKTILHQSVSFWSGQYKWDLQLRERITTWLCEVGADPGSRDGEGRSSFDLALQSEDKHLTSILEKAIQGRIRDAGQAGLVELAG
jgi:ankyrin repeat protein